MTNVRSFLFAAAAGLTLAGTGCTFEPAAGDEDLAAQLRRRVTLDVSTQSNVDVSAMAAGGRMVAVDPSVLGGEAVLRTTADGWLLVEDLELPLEDVIVPAGLLGNRPVTITELSLRLGTQLAIQPLGNLPDDSNTMIGYGRADLLLDWAMLSWRGDVLPLAMRRIPSAPFAVAVTRDAAGQMHASITARVDGVIDDLGELVVLHDLALDVVTATPDVIEP